MAAFRRDPPNEGVECRWGRQKSRFPTSIWLHRVLSTQRPARCYQHGAAGPWQVVTLIAGSKRRSLLMPGDDEKMLMTRRLNVTPQTTERHLSARSVKSVAYVTNNKRLHSTFCTIEANYWQTRSSARPLCDSRASCIMYCSDMLKVCRNALLQIYCWLQQWMNFDKKLCCPREPARCFVSVCS